VLLLACYKAGVQIFEYTPMQVKQAVVGYGLAEKKQVIYMVTSILNMKSPPKPDDAADALALAICHARSTTSLIYKNGGDDPCSTT
jgi:crossover junction endodeoxyribonuclease RuvC